MYSSIKPYDPNEYAYSDYSGSSGSDSVTDTKPEVILGPIIGDVTHNSARILIEFNISGTFKCILKSSRGEIRSPPLECKAKVPQVFSFKKCLIPKTHYDVFFENWKLPIESSFQTLRENHDKPGVLRVAVISCNEISRHEEKVKENGKNLWASLYGLVAGKQLDCILHIGDQVYMDMGKNERDCPYQRCCAILKKTPRDLWDLMKDDLLEIIREQYRKTWAEYKSIKFVLANVPNLMMCDDHEFRDDWGFRDEDSQKGTLDNFYGELARKVYYEYQRQLREDIPWGNLKSLKRESYHKIIHNVGISFMDYRGCRSWFRDVHLKETHMGANQLEWIESLYKPGGTFDHLTSTLFVSPVPLYFLSHGMSKVARVHGDDIQEHFTYDSMAQLKFLLDLLRNWKERGPLKPRQVVLVGGDVHMGGFTEIYYKDNDHPVFTQIVSSAINGKAIHWYEKLITDILQYFRNKSGNYKFKHKGWIKENNYGVIQLNSSYRGPSFNATLHTE